MPVPGGGVDSAAKPRPAPQYKAIGILYVKAGKEDVDFRVIYEGHISQDVKALVAELFGVGAMEWLEK